MSKLKLVLALLIAAVSLNTFAEDESTSSMMFSKQPHTVQLLDIGGVSLNKMLEIIDNAQSTVEVSNYLIGYSDYSGILVLEALRKKGRENPNFHASVIIEDSTSGGYRKQNFWQWRAFVQKYKAQGVEFRLFNPSVNNPVNVNVRQHQKYIIADGKEMVLGGRNLSDDYYGIIPVYNRLDKEVYVKGPIVKMAHARFQELWNGEFVYNLLENSDAVEQENDLHLGNIAQANDTRSRNEINKVLTGIDESIEQGIDGLALKKFGWLKHGGENMLVLYTPEMEAKFKSVGYMQSGPDMISYPDFLAYQNLPAERHVTMMSVEQFRQLMRDTAAKHAAPDLFPPVEVKEIGLGYDLPGRFSKANSFVDYFYQTLREAKTEVVFENQYFIPTKKAWDTLQQMQKNGVKIKFLTNSLVSQDESNPGELTHDDMRSFLKSNPGLFQPYAFRGQKLAGIPDVYWFPGTEANKEECVWQIHAKAAAIDGTSAWVGSNNFDSRSERFNPESAIYVANNPTFATQVQRSIQYDIDNGDDMSLEGDYWKRYDQKMSSRKLTDKVIDSSFGLIRTSLQIIW